MNLIEVIPKITSPLAVICFAFYIFYLFKRNQDKKKEKSLLVKDKRSQGEAAILILKDYPNIEIDTIKDQNGAIDIAKQMVGDKLRRYNKTLNTLLLFSLIFALTYLVSLWLSKDTIKPDPEPSCNESWSKTESIRNSYSYATISVVQHIKLRKLPNNDSINNVLAEFRNHYVVSANRDITSNETIFEEQFTTTIGQLVPWSGTDKQKIKSNDPANYWVYFDLKKDEIKSIVTGVNFNYKLPSIKKNQQTCFNLLVLNSDEWFTCYPNALDYIDDLTIVIESDELDISLPPNSAYRKIKPESEEIVSEGSCKVYGDNNNCTLSASWKKISPGECVGFKIRWKLKD